MQSGPNRLVALRPHLRLHPEQRGKATGVCRLRPHRHAAACRSRPSSRLLAPAARLSIRPPSFPLPSPPLFSPIRKRLRMGASGCHCSVLSIMRFCQKKSHALATNRRFAKITSLRRRFRSPLRYADLRNRRSQNRPCLTRFSVFRKTAIGRHLRTVFA